MVSSAGDPDPGFSIAKCKAVYPKILSQDQAIRSLRLPSYSPDAKEEAVQNVLANTWEALVSMARARQARPSVPVCLGKVCLQADTRDHPITGGHLVVEGTTCSGPLVRRRRT